MDFNEHGYAVCPRCGGKGQHSNPAIDGNGLTREDFDQDPDFERDYLSGVYGVTCRTCKGHRVVTQAALDQHKRDIDDLRVAAAESGDWELYGTASAY
jgi:hypothetical protein